MSGEIPELKSAIEDQGLSVSKASRVVSGLTAENATEVLAFAQTHTSREIDREMARRNPDARIRDHIRPVSSDRFEVRAHVSKAAFEKIERAQSLLAQKGRATSIEAVLEAALEEFLNRHDPVRKAERAQKRTQVRYARSRSAKKLRPNRVHQSPSRSGTRIPLSAEVKHAVFVRDQGRCTHVNEQGERCGSDRWIDIHHLKPVHRGGRNALSNLTTLCSFHHDLVHQLSFPIEGQVNWLRAPRMVYEA